jgi:serine/threonine protein kinase
MPDLYSPRTGDVIAGQYRLQSCLGRGGMAVVYLAEDVSLKRLVAVKFIVESALDELVTRERFVREAQLMAKIEHPNVLPVHQVSTHQNVPFIVTKYLEGDSLAALLDRKETIAFDRLLSWIHQAARALDALHQLAIIHRDVKPSNLLIGEGDHLWLIDFGIARQTHTSNLTERGLTVGTALYAAPEALTGGVCDGRVDQYALALTAYQLATSELPTTGETPYARTQEKLSGFPASTLTQMLSAPVRRVFSRAFSPDPTDRFETCTDFFLALETAAKTKQASVALTEDIVLHPTQAKRRVVMFLALGAALVLAAGVALQASGKPTEAPTETATQLPLQGADSGLADIDETPVTDEMPQQKLQAPVNTAPVAAKGERQKPVRKPKTPKISCDPPWEIDAQGDKHYKRQCLK